MNKKILAFGVVGLLAYSVPANAINSYAADNTPANNEDLTSTSDIMLTATGLISRYNATVSNHNGYLRLNGYVESDSRMKSIGFIDIEVQRSSDNEHWTKEKGHNDMLASSSYEKDVNNHDISVVGGYYYRISYTSYAKESTFGSSQSIVDTSNSVWID